MINEELNASGLPGDQTPDGDNSDVGEVKDILNETLGKDFPTDEAALKAVKDTFSFVGKTKSYQSIIDEIKQGNNLKTDDEAIDFIKGLSKPKSDEGNKSDFVSRGELAERDFFNDNQQYKPYKNLIKSWANSNGLSIDEAVNSEEFKPIIEKVLAHDKSENAKSVLHSTGRLSSLKDKFAEAGKAVGSEDLKQVETGKKLAVDAVLDAYERE